MQRVMRMPNFLYQLHTDGFNSPTTGLGKPEGSDVVTTFFGLYTLVSAFMVSEHRFGAPTYVSFTMLFR